jgi:drug/metabolite transporter (DMT)-like permease
LLITAPVGDIVLPILYITIFASIGATFFWNYGVQHVGAIRAGYLVNLIPVFSIIWALFLVGELIELYQIVGMILVCAGIGMALFKTQTS